MKKSPEPESPKARPGSKPPPGPPWDLPLAEAPLAFLDLEMTGLDPKKDRVVEVCIERVVGGEVVDRLYSLVRPDGGETGNEHIHGIENVEDAPTWPELAPRIVELLDGAVLVAHGAWWDVAFVRAEMERAREPSKAPPPAVAGFVLSHYLDTLNLSRRSFGLERHSLDALRAHFQLDTSRAHRADADVLALREVFARCVAELEPSTPRDLWEVRVAERRVREHVLAQCKEALEAEREITLIYRARARPAEPLRMRITAIDLGLDPPRVIGYQLPGRGRRELRADRILRIE